MKKIKLISSCLSFLAVSFAFISIAHSTDMQSSTVELEVQPTSIEVSYGASNQQIPVSFYVVNNADYAQDLDDYTLTALNPPGNNPITVGALTDNCNGQIPKQGGSGVCTISGMITASNPGSLSPINYQFSLKYGAGRPSVPLTSAPFPVSFATGELQPELSRTFTFVNYCNYDVNVGISSGSTNPQNTPYVPGEIPPPCSTESSATNACYPGSTCSTAVSPNVCFWNNPTPAKYLLNKFQGGTPDSTTVTFPAYDNGIDLIWNGSIAARTGCANSGASNCATADCLGTAGGACLLTQGFATPSSIAEISLLNQMPIVTSNTPNGNTDVDTYDVSIINGINVPVSIEPTNGVWGGETAPYTCGAPGSGLERAPLGGCTWSPPGSGTYPITVDYVWVSAVNSGDTCSACTNPDTCTACTTMGEVCGTSFNGSVVSANVCGPQLGYWTTDELCGKDPSNTIVGNCTDNPPALSPQDPQLPAGATYADLYQCANGLKNSCYTAGANEGDCCGCQDWDQLNPPITIPSTTTGLTVSCNGIDNPYWSQYSLPSLKWLKNVCPTAYAYPYDDKSSTFTCQTLNEQNVNVTNYTVTFCPPVIAK